jgi:hypothetical protein
VAPVSADQYRITITASREMKDELSRVQDLLRHQIPDGDPGKILARSLSLLREQLETSRSCRSPTRGVDAGRRPLRVRGQGWVALRRARWARVPSHRALRAPRRGDGSEHLPPLPGPQRPRGRGLVRTPRAGAATRSGTSDPPRFCATGRNETGHNTEGIGSEVGATMVQLSP